MIRRPPRSPLFPYTALFRSLQTGGPLELSACLRIFEQVASALDYAHRRGVAHGALTPDSIIVDANEWALVSDFAMRGLLDAAPDGGRAGEPAAGADQRALAAIAHQCLTGIAMGEDPPTADDGPSGLPLHVSQALRRALSSRQADRFPSVLDFVAALGGTRPDARTAWFGANPRKKGAGSPVVIVDGDRDPAPPPPLPPARVDQPNLDPGLLSVNAIPWGSVCLDGQPIGNTPQVDRTVAPGRHRLRVEREGYRPYDRVIDVASGQRLRITDIALVER